MYVNNNRVVDFLERKIIESRDMLPYPRDYAELAEAIISNLNPKGDPNTLSQRANVLVNMALENLADSEWDLTHMHGAPLPLEHRINARLTHDSEIIQELAQSQLEDYEEYAEEEDAYLPYRFWYQITQAATITCVPEECYRFALVVELFYPTENVEEWEFSGGGETGNLMSIKDAEGFDISDEALADIYVNYYLPVINLGERTLEAAETMSEIGDDLDLLEEVNDISDLLGGDEG